MLTHTKWRCAAQPIRFSVNWFDLVCSMEERNSFFSRIRPGLSTSDLSSHVRRQKTISDLPNKQFLQPFFFHLQDRISKMINYNLFFSLLIVYLQMPEPLFFRIIALEKEKKKNSHMRVDPKFIVKLIFEFNFQDLDNFALITFSLLDSFFFLQND